MPTPNRFSISAILLLAACAPPAADESGTSASSVTRDGSGLVRAEPGHAFEGAAGKYSASNPALGIAAKLDQGGARISSGSGAIKLSLTGFGRDESVASVSPVVPTLGIAPGTQRSRVDYAHDGVTVWWDNTSAGIQQGFLIDRAPTGKGELALRVGVYGAMAESQGEMVVFRDQSGGTWQYAGLGAEDANGNTLPARMQLVGGSVVLLVDDVDATYPISVDPFTTYTVGTVYGEGTGDELGYSVGTGKGGDINGDGFPDVVVGAPSYGGGEGRVYVYYGNASGMPESVGIVLDTPRSGAEFGSSVSIIGDVNGDGFADVAVGGPLASVVSASDGAVWIYHGSASGVSDVPATEITGSATASAYFGHAVEGGDINADGFTDLIVGEYGYSSELGRAWIFAGSAAGMSTTVSRTFTGATAGARFGYAVTIGGSYNGDAFADFAVGQPYYTTASLGGRAYHYPGSATSFTTTTTAVTKSGSTGYRYGWSVTLDGSYNNDVDGDADLVVGAPTGAASGNGRVYYYNSTGTALPAGATDTITGGSSGMYFGASLAPLGDLNGDGFEDLLVGGPTYGTTQGYAAVYTGKINSTGLSTSPHQEITGLSGDFLGMAVAGMGDINRDGYSDFIVGSPGASTGGAASVYYGGVDADGDGYLENGMGTLEDCDDTSDLVNPGESEMCDEFNTDENCDGQSEETGAVGESTWYADADGDGHGDAGATVLACDQPVGYVADGSDCDDANKDVHPDAQEVCDALDVDEDCNGLGDDDDSGATGQITFYADDDADGYGAGGAVDFACDSALGVPADGDCDAFNPDINPGAQEVCDELDVDEDCDGLSDDADSSATGQVAWYADSDVDGYGDGLSPMGLACDVADASLDKTDCDDGNASINPGKAEVCDANDVDENCNGASDEAGAIGEVRWYFDTDADGYGEIGGLMTIACDARGASTDQTDCDDDEAAVNPGATEVCDALNVDEDCDGQGDESGASGELTWYADADADGFGDVSVTALSCDQPSAFVENKKDCDDASAAINPAATEVCDASNVDEDCDGTAEEAGASGESRWFEDGDSDGYGDASSFIGACDEPSGYTADNTDCNDEKGAINPGATEVCDALDTDENCNGTADDSSATGRTEWYPDVDNDTYGNNTQFTLACDAPSGSIATRGDCDDLKADVNPGEIEICDALDTDENCDGAADDATAAGMTTWYLDSDEDGYGNPQSTVTACDAPTGAESTGTDCNDASAAVNPGAIEVCDAADTDENCDGLADDASATGQVNWYDDRDVDGYGDPAAATAACDAPVGFLADNTDCVGDDEAYHPGADESDCTDPNDYNCDGAVAYADLDGDGYAACEDCDDTSFAVNPSAIDETADGIDSDCDGVELCFVDADSDFYTDGSGTTVVSLDPSCADAGEADATVPGGDCADTDPDRNPGEREECDGIDENCDSVVDDGYAFVTYYADVDSDGFGVDGSGHDECAPPEYSATVAGDCDDATADVSPAAPEVCDAANADENCDGNSNEAGAAGELTFYADVDGDGYGDAAMPMTDCEASTGYVANGTDCDDVNGSAYPGATEVAGDSIDQDCDGQEWCFVDVDDDEYLADAEALVLSTDTDCDDSGEAPVGSNAGDCDDENSAYNPGVLEDDCTDPSDYNCDGAVGYTDDDGDGYAACEECNDADPAINGSAIETVGDGVDFDCDGTEECLVDGDGDRYTTGDGAVVTSEDADCADLGEAAADAPEGDCDDGNASISPEGTDVPDDFIDQDCDGTDATLGGSEDTGTVDTGAVDTGSEDTAGETGEVETGSEDTGPVDTGWDDTAETGTVDTGAEDTGTEDTAETGEIDTGSADSAETGVVDTGSEETGTIDTAETGTIDTGSEDTGPVDTSVEETGDTSVVDDTGPEDADDLPDDEDTGEVKEVPPADCGCDGESSGLVGVGVMLLVAGGLARRKK